MNTKDHPVPRPTKHYVTFDDGSIVSLLAIDNADALLIAGRRNPGKTINGVYAPIGNPTQDAFADDPLRF